MKPQTAMIYIVNTNDEDWSWQSLYVVEAENRIEAIKKVRDKTLAPNIGIISESENALEPIQVFYL